MVGFAALLLASSLAAPHAGGGGQASPVILVTIDGVRYQEVFDGLDRRLAGPATAGAPTDLMPRLRARAAREGLLTGDASRGDGFAVSAPSALSLPGYQVILAGQLGGGCQDNQCGRVVGETVLERARRELGLGHRDVAVFAGWPEIALAVEQEEGQVTVDVGLEPHPPWSPPDETLQAIFRAQRADRPPWPHRRDRYTWELAMQYLQRFRPRILYVGLGDPDEWGHLGNYGAYAAAVQELDARLEELFEALTTMGPYGAGASVLVTTDHGRGAGDEWRHHGPGIAGSEHGWLFASTPFTRTTPAQAAKGQYDHGSVRPTMEALLGLTPCEDCQRPIAELIAPGPADWIARKWADAR